jgi:hypothetical protein
MNIDPAIYRQICFQPPFCPNEDCEKHLISDFEGRIGEDEIYETSETFTTEEQERNKERKKRAKKKLFYRVNGWSTLQVYPYRNRKYQCLHCGRNFCYSYFKLYYRAKLRGLDSEIFRLFTCGTSNRHIARHIGCSEHTVREKLKNMSLWALMKQAEYLNGIKISEPIAYDGLENFSSSQYDPNHIQQCIGTESLFIYDFNFAPLNRKGRMSDRQKRIRNEIEGLHGRYDTRAVRKSSKVIFERLHSVWDHSKGPMVLITDRHFQYDRAVKRDLKHLKINHVRISSKDTRNFQNQLFPVNHADLLIRQHVGAFRRETISFSKTALAMILKYNLFMVWMNFFRPNFVKKHVNRPTAHTHTPAMELGITTKPVKFNEFFDIRITPKQVKLNPEWLCFYQGIPTYQRISAKRA